MLIKFWGVRGSLPAPVMPEEKRAFTRKLLQDFVKFGPKKSNITPFLKNLGRPHIEGFGGHTTCVEVTTDKAQFIIDGGTGIRPIGEGLLAGPCGRGQGEVHILFTHFHWDHLIGLPFFVPIFIPGNKIHIYAVQPELESVIRMLFKKPFFPVPYEALGSEIIYHQMEPRKPTAFGDMNVIPYEVDHPDPCWGFKIEHNKKIFSYCTDTECTRSTREELGPDLPLYQGVDLLAFDAQYTLGEITEKINWGHSVASIGLDIAMREAIKEVLFIHHDPSASVEKILQAEAQTREYYQQQFKFAKMSGEEVYKVKWSFAYDGLKKKL